jgi:hypothetical protein
MHVLGIPRVNLAEVAAIQPGKAVDLPLPYEMIIVAVLPDEESNVANAHPEGPHPASRNGSGRKR